MDDIAVGAALLLGFGLLLLLMMLVGSTHAELIVVVVVVEKSSSRNTIELIHTCRGLYRGDDGAYDRRRAAAVGGKVV